MHFLAGVGDWGEDIIQPIVSIIERKDGALCRKGWRRKITDDQ